MSVPDGVRERLNRRRLALLVLLLLALIGLGVGTLTDGPAGPDGPPVVDVTPTPPTATPGPPGTDTPTPPDDGTPTPPDDDTPPPSPPTTAPPAEDGDGDGGGGGAGAGGGTASPVTLEAAGSTAILQYSDLKPGDAGSDGITLRNAGTVPARLDIADLNVTDRENGIVAAEAPVDTPGNGGELSEHVMVDIEVTYPDGTTEHFYNTGTGPRSLADLAAVGSPSTGQTLAPGEQATVTFDWHVPSATGNVIQSDGADFTVDFRLRTT